jgi:hypothetical protein
MNVYKAMEELWESAPLTSSWFEPKQIDHLPLEAARFLLHVLAPGAPLSAAAHIKMHGTVRTDVKGDTWHPFEADQVLRWDRGFIWHARVHTKGLSLSGYDRFIDGEGEMRWKMLGLIPVVTERGPEIARSAAGRFHGEALWMPGVLLAEGVRFDIRDEHLAVDIEAHGETSHLMLSIDGRGAVQSFHYPRWGDPDKQGFRYEEFGGLIDEERTFQGVTVPSKLRLGWYVSDTDERRALGPSRFTAEGEFIRIEVDDITYR